LIIHFKMLRTNSLDSIKTLVFKIDLRGRIVSLGDEEGVIGRTKISPLVKEVRSD